MSHIFTFIVENPLIFIIIVLAIYAVIAIISLKNKVKEIEKAFKPLKSYILEKFESTLSLLNEIVSSHSDDEKITNELNRIIGDINKAKSGDINTIIKTTNDINYFVLNTALLRTKDYPELVVLYNIEMFGVPENDEEKDLEARRKRYNELIKDFNHDILNPPNSIIASLLNMGNHYIMIEVNEGKTPKVATTNYVKIEQPVLEKQPIAEEKVDENGISAAPDSTGVATEIEKKVCPECNTEFNNSKFCPTCGRMVD